MSPLLLSHPFHLLFSSSLLLLLVFHIPAANAQQPENQDPLNYTCEGTTTYTKPSTFARDLKDLLSSLSFNSSQSETKGFYEGTRGENISNTVYGQILCRGDSEPDKCHDCIEKARTKISSSCNTKTAVIWYDTCQLRYSDTDFFGDSTNPWVFYRPSLKNINASDLDSFRENLGKLMYELAEKIRAQKRLRNFATGDANYAGLMTVYGLVQCVPDIKPTECHKCLTDAIRRNIPECCVDKIGGRVIGPVCALRFETTHQFYGDSKVEDDSGKGVNRVLILVPAFTGVIILALMAAFVYFGEYSRWSKKDVQQSRTAVTQPDVKKETGKQEEKKEEEINVEA